MYLDLIVQIVAAVLWLGAEAYLIRSDRDAEGDAVNL